LNVQSIVAALISGRGLLAIQSTYSIDDPREKTLPRGIRDVWLTFEDASKAGLSSATIIDHWCALHQPASRARSNHVPIGDE